MKIMDRLADAAQRRRSPANLRQRRKYSTNGIVHNRLIHAARVSGQGVSIGDVLEELVMRYIPPDVVPIKTRKEIAKAAKPARTGAYGAHRKFKTPRRKSKVDDDADAKAFNEEI